VERARTGGQKRTLSVAATGPYSAHTANMGSLNARNIRCGVALGIELECEAPSTACPHSQGSFAPAAQQHLPMAPLELLLLPVALRSCSSCPRAALSLHAPPQLTSALGGSG
jgi:hypothetical protein